MIPQISPFGPSNKWLSVFTQRRQSMRMLHFNIHSSLSLFSPTHLRVSCVTQTSIACAQVVPLIQRLPLRTCNNAEMIMVSMRASISYNLSHLATELYFSHLPTADHTCHRYQTWQERATPWQFVLGSHHVGVSYYSHAAPNTSLHCVWCFLLGY